MKKSILFLTIAVFVLMAVSCKKESCLTPETASIVGFWKGSYGNSAEIPSNYYSMLFRANGTVRVFSGGTDTSSATQRGEGTYVLSGTSLTTTYRYTGAAASTSTGTVDSKFTLTRGNWAYPGIPGGTYWMNKQ